MNVRSITANYWTCATNIITNQLIINKLKYYTNKKAAI